MNRNVLLYNLPFFCINKREVNVFEGLIYDKPTWKCAETAIFNIFTEMKHSGVESLITAWSHTFVEIDNEIISTAILLPSADSRRVVVSNKQKYVHKVLVNCYVKLAQEKKCG